MLRTIQPVLHSSVALVMIAPRQEPINEVHNRLIEPVVSHPTRQAGMGVLKR